MHAGNRPDQPDRPVERFPAHDIAPVRARIRQLIDVLSPDAVVSAPSAGADLIVLESALELGVPVHVVVPIDRDEFVRCSVADAGAIWARRFEHVLHRAGTDPRSTILQERGVAVAGWEGRANAAVIARARELAEDGRRTLGLTVRPLPPEDPPSVTDDFACRAAAEGWPVLTLDPRHDDGIVVG